MSKIAITFVMLAACGTTPAAVELTIHAGALIESVALVELTAYRARTTDGKQLGCDEDRTAWSERTEIVRAAKTQFATGVSGELAIVADGEDVVLDLIAYDSEGLPARVIGRGCTLLRRVQPGSRPRATLVLEAE